MGGAPPLPLQPPSVQIPAHECVFRDFNFPYSIPVSKMRHFGNRPRSPLPVEDIRSPHQQLHFVLRTFPRHTGTPSGDLISQHGV
jgi:hypothetical protein